MSDEIQAAAERLKKLYAGQDADAIYPHLAEGFGPMRDEHTLASAFVKAFVARGDSMAGLGKSLLLESLQTLNQLRTLVEENIAGPVEILLNARGSWDVRWNEQGDCGSADNLDHGQMVERLETMSTQPVK